MKYLILTLSICCGFNAVAQDTAATAAENDPAIVAENYENWARQELQKAIREKAEFERVMTTFNVFSGEANLVAWEYKPSDPMAFAAGGISLTCDPDPNPKEGTFGTLGLTEDQKQALCDWRLWKIDYNPEGTLANKLSANALDMDAALSWLAKRRTGMPAIKKSTPILWASFAEISASKLEWGATKDTRWSAKSCPGITNLLTEIETFPDVPVDLRNFGKTTPKGEIKYDKDASVSLSVFTQNGFTIEYPSLSTTTHAVNEKIQTLMQNCAPDSR